MAPPPPTRTDRFVAGPRFYNYDMFGGLRAGGTIRLCSRAFVGLAVSAFASAFIYIGLRDGLLPEVCAQLQFTPLETQAVDRLAELPAAFSFFIGVATDAKPLIGFHRKAYMILGLLLVLLSMLSLSVLFCFEAPLRHVLQSGFVYVATLLVGCVSVGSMIAFVATHTMVVALSQRESLHDRGQLQAKYLVVRVSGQLAARVVVFAIDQVDDDARAMHVPLVMLALSLVAIWSLATTIACLDEDEDATQHSMRASLHQYWTLTQQKGVWRVLGFISCFAFAIGFKIAPAQRAVRHWTHIDATRTSMLVLYTTTDCVTLVTVVIWRRWFMNTLWRRVFAFGPIAAITSQCLQLACVTTGVMRDPAFFLAITSLTGVASALVALSTLVPVTEIAQEGSEGGVVGLALSFYAVSKVFSSTFLSALQRLPVLQLSGGNDSGGAIRDSTSTREFVAIAQLLTIAAHALGFAAIVLLPQQKLDAQQLRTFGGFTRTAGRVIIVVFVGLLVYCTVLNVLVLIPSTAKVIHASSANSASSAGTNASSNVTRTNNSSRVP